MQAPWQQSRLSDKTTQLIIAGILGAILGVMFLFLPPLTVALLTGVAFLAVLAIKKPELALLGLLVIISSLFPDTAFPRINLIAFNLYITDILIVVFLFLIILRWLVDRNYPLIRTPLDIPFLAFCVWAAVTALYGYWMNDVPRYRMIPELRMAEYYISFFLFTNLLRTPGSLRFLLRWFFILATLVGVVMIVQYFLGYTSPILAGRVEVLVTSEQGRIYQEVTRITDTSGEGLITMAFMLKSVMLFIDRLRIRKMADLIQWGIIGTGFLMTFNRTHWLMAFFVIGMTALLVGKQERQKLLYWSLAVILLGVFLISAILILLPESGPATFLRAFGGRLFSVTASDLYRDPNTSTLLWRNFEYEYGLPQVWSHPIMGLGLGANYRPLLMNVDGYWSDGRHFVHNSHLWVAMKTGLVGFFFYLWFLLGFVWHGLRSWRSVADVSLRGMVLGSALSILAIVIGANAHAITMSLYWIPVLTFVIGTSEVIILRHSNHARGQI